MKKIIVYASFIIFLSVLTLLYINNKDYSLDRENDINTFITEYESLNNTLNGNEKFLDLNLNDNSIIYISSAEEVAELIKNSNDSFLVYFGFSSCPWCRNMISCLLNVTEELNVPIYYVDINNIRNEFSVENDLVIESKEGTDGYYELLLLLDEYLEDYYINYEGEYLNTNYKRIFGPTILSVISGEVEDIKVGTLSEVSNPYIELDNEQYLKLYEEIENIVIKIVAI